MLASVRLAPFATVSTYGNRFDIIGKRAKCIKTLKTCMLIPLCTKVCMQWLKKSQLGHITKIVLSESLNFLL